MKREEISKINIKGVFQIWLRDGSYHEVSLKEGHEWTREGCTRPVRTSPPEHADSRHRRDRCVQRLDTCRSSARDQGREVIDGMIADGAIETRPGDDDPGAIELLKKLYEGESPPLAGNRSRGSEKAHCFYARLIKSSRAREDGRSRASRFGSVSP